MKKYLKGANIVTFEEFLKQEFIFHHHKVYHRGWFLGWSIHFANAQIKAKYVYFANKIQKGESNVINE